MCIVININFYAFKFYTWSQNAKFQKSVLSKCLYNYYKRKEDLAKPM